MGKCISVSKSKKELTSTIIQEDPDDSIPEIESAIVINRIPGGQSKALIEEALKGQYLFKGLSVEDMEMMYSKLKYYEVPANEVIFAQGSIGKKFYIIEKGLVKVQINGKLKNELKPGETFGEMALLTSAERRATLTTAIQTYLWGMGREQFLAAVRVINKKNFEVNKNFISNLSIFSFLSEEKLVELTESLVQHDFDHNKRIICEGDKGLLMYVVKSGNAVAKINSVEKYRISKGEMFGENVVIGDNLIRNITVYSDGDTSLLSISREDIIRIIGENFKETVYRAQAKNSLNSDYFTRKLGDAMIMQIIDKMEWKSIKPMEVAIDKSELEENIFVLCVGSLVGKEINFSHFEVFGFKMKMIKNEDQLVAGSEVVLGILKKMEFEKIYKAPWSKLKYEVKVMMLLSRVDMFAGKSPNDLRYIASHSRLQEYDKNEVVYRYNDEALSMFIIKKGSVEITHNGKTIRVMGKYDIFGDKCIDEPLRTNTARTLSPSVFVVIDTSDIQDLIDDTTWKVLKRKQTFLCNFSLNHVMMIKMISQNNHKLYFHCKISNPDIFATCTVIKKNYYENEQKFNTLVQEKTILLMMESRYIINLLKSFCDDKYVYLVYEFDESVPLSTILSRRPGEDYAKFIAACLYILLKSFHDKDIIFRGISTNTIRISSNGYPIIDDLSTAKIIRGRTSTIIGDPLFLAPEVHLGKPYTRSADLWSLGILIYLMLYDSYPFNITDGDDPVQIFEKTQGELKFPSETKFVRGKEVISELLRKNSKERLNLENLRFSRWLDSIDWEKLMKFEVIPAHKPTISQKSKQVKNQKQIPLARYLNVTHI
jgi:cGMP-dependent protein kinase